MGARSHQIALLTALACLCYGYWEYQSSPTYLKEAPAFLQVTLRGKWIIETLGETLERSGLSTWVNVYRSNINLLARFFLLPDWLSDVTVENTMFGHLGARIYYPANRRFGGSAIIYFHGGSGIFGTADLFDPFPRSLSQRLSAVVIYIDYRLAPEHSHQEIVADCEFAVRYVIRNADKWNISRSNISLLGDSSGAFLSTMVAVRLRDNFIAEEQVRSMMLIYPYGQMVNLSTVSIRRNHNDLLISIDHMLMYGMTYLLGNDYYNVTKRDQLRQYLLGSCAMQDPQVRDMVTRILHLDTEDNLYNRILSDSDRKYLLEQHSPSFETTRCNFSEDTLQEMHKQFLHFAYPDHSVIFTPSFANIPKTMILTCEHDVTRDDALLLLARLREANVPTHHVHLNKYHGFIFFEHNIAVEEIYSFLSLTAV